MTTRRLSRSARVLLLACAVYDSDGDRHLVCGLAVEFIVAAEQILSIRLVLV